MAARKKPSTAVAKWDEELARQAEVAAKQEESTASGQFFSLRGGVLTFNDAPLPNNEVAVVILDHLLENVYYEGAYDPDDPSGPTCFAFGRSDDEMTPHQKVIDADQFQADACKDCPNNEWGSAETGRGKACRNTRRLALIPAGNFNSKTGEFEEFDDPEHYESAAIAFMKLPVTSVKGYAAFVKQIASALKRPPHGVFTKIKVVPDASTQFKVTFEALGQVPNELLGAIMPRHEEAQGVIEFPYELDSEREEPKKPTHGKKAPTKKPARGRGKY